jgi:hypothetical protein
MNLDPHTPIMHPLVTQGYFDASAKLNCQGIFIHHPRASRTEEPGPSLR